MAKEEGITLIALLVSLVVLILLASVTIINVFELNFIDTSINSTINYTKVQNNEINKLEEVREVIDNSVEKVEEQLQNS